MVTIRLILVGLLLLGSSLWASVGKVALVRGEAFASRADQKIALQNGSVLEEKDTINTSKNTQIQLAFDDKTVITLGSDSEFIIQEYLNDATNPKAKFKFNQGTFKSITGKIGKIAPQNFLLETRTSTIGIRGTIIRGSIGKNGDSIACLRGRIFVVSKDTGKSVDVDAGQFTIVTANEEPTQPQKITSDLSKEEPITQTTPSVVTTVENISKDIKIQKNIENIKNNQATTSQNALE